MKKINNKLTIDDIIGFFTSKPSFDKSNTESFTSYCWPSTKDGLYTKLDIERYFEKLGYNRNDVDWLFYDQIQLESIFDTHQILEKGRSCIIQTIDVINYKYNKGFLYYCYNLSKDEVLKLKFEYESESKNRLIELSKLELEKPTIMVSQSVKKQKIVEKRKK